MAFFPYSGLKLRIGSALLFAFVLGGGVLVAGATAQARNDFNGQLDYDAFQKAAREKRTVRITYSPGGTGAAAMALAKVKDVVIDGRCNSACAWSFVSNANACYTSRASFGFHAAHDPGTGRRLNAATEFWLAKVRPSLRGRLDGLLSSSNLINVSSREMSRYYGDRLCGARRTEVAAVALPKTAAHRKASRRGRPDLRPASSFVAHMDASARNAVVALTRDASFAWPSSFALGVGFAGAEPYSVALILEAAQEVMGAEKRVEGAPLLVSDLDDERPRLLREGLGGDVHNSSPQFAVRLAELSEGRCELDTAVPRREEASLGLSLAVVATAY